VCAGYRTLVARTAAKVVGKHARHRRQVTDVSIDDPEQRGYRAAALLRRRMERCGVSRWHPDPIAACEAAEAKE
jgi:hypothetical protein